MHPRDKTLMTSPFVPRRVSPKWFTVFAFCQGITLIGQGRLFGTEEETGAQRNVACARLSSHVEVTLLQCKDLRLVGKHLICYRFLLDDCKKSSL